MSRLITFAAVALVAANAAEAQQNCGPRAAVIEQLDDRGELGIEDPNRHGFGGERREFEGFLCDRIEPERIFEVELGCFNLGGESQLGDESRFRTWFRRISVCHSIREHLVDEQARIFLICVFVFGFALVVFLPFLLRSYLTLRKTGKLEEIVKKKEKTF